MRALALHPRRRAVAGVATAGLVLSGTAALSLHGSPAAASVLGSVTLTPSSGTDSTLVNGSVDATCPAGTGDSYFSVDGPDLSADQAILAPGNATGVGTFSFTGASISNIRATNTGSFAGDGTYTFRFSCVATATGLVTDSYTKKIAYHVASGGSWAFLAATATTTTLAASPTQAYTGQDQTLTATVSPSAAAGTVQFKDGATNLGAPVAVAAGSAQLTLSGVNRLAEGAHSLTAVFTSSDTDAYGSSTSAAKSYPVAGAPSWRPVLYPAPKVGAASLCLAGFDNVPTATTYAWYLNGVQIGGAAASSYTVPETSYAKSSACKATASNPAGEVSATSAAATVGVGRALTPTVKPYIYGTVKVGYTVTAKYGTWSPTSASYAYAWYVGTTKVSSASTYRIPAAYKGKALSLLVTAKRPGWTNGSYKTAAKTIA
jgi:hypothetical protein